MVNARPSSDPPAVLSEPEPRTVAPSLNVTVPVGLGPVPPGGVTRAVSVRDWPRTGDRTEFETETPAPPVTETGSDDEVLAASSPSPPYTAVIECEPAASTLVVKVTVPTPPRFKTGPVPRVFEPSLNVTVPVGVPAPGGREAAMAVNVTD